MTAERTVGRRPDPAIEPRVFAAALVVYAEVGWAAFTLDAVSRRARVGKAALYGRWSDKASLLTDALLSRHIEPEVINTGTLRGDLLAVARVELDLSTGELGRALRRAELDAIYFPEIFATVRDTFRRNVIDAGRDIIQRAVARGELLGGVSAALILDALSGSVEHRIAYIPDGRRDDFDRRASEYLETVVDFVLAAATSPSAQSHYP